MSVTVGRPVPPAYKGASLPNVDLFLEGDHRGEEWTPDHLEAMVRNFELAKGVIDVPFVLGHEEKQLLTGVPASGWLTAIRRKEVFGEDGEPRAGLGGDLSRVRPDVAAWLNAGAWTRLSLEIYDEDKLPPEAVALGCKGPMVRRASALGGEQPQLKMLGRLPVAVWSEKSPRRLVKLKYAGRERTADGRCWQVFFEVTKMADDKGGGGGGGAPDLESVVDDLITAQPVTLTPDIVANLSPEVKAQIAATLTPSGGDTPTEPEPGPTPMAEWPEDVTRESAIADLVAAGEDAAALDAMSDDEILALWQEKVGGAVPMSETKKKGGAAPAITPKQFSELRTLLARVPAVQRQLATLTADVSRRKQAERASTVKAYCERWNRDGYVTASEVDPGSTKPNLYHRLMHADGSRVRKFGESSLTDFDAAVAEIEARGPGYVRRYGERIAEPMVSSESQRAAEEAKAYAARRNAAAGKRAS